MSLPATFGVEYTQVLRRPSVDRLGIWPGAALVIPGQAKAGQRHYRRRPAYTLNGGGGEIRTLETDEPPNGFQDRRIQPLCHSSGQKNILPNPRASCCAQCWPRGVDGAKWYCEMPQPKRSRYSWSTAMPLVLGVRVLDLVDLLEGGEGGDHLDGLVIRVVHEVDLARANVNEVTGG